METPKGEEMEKGVENGKNGKKLQIEKKQLYTFKKLKDFKNCILKKIPK